MELTGKTYVQKSKLFLLPLINVKKDPFIKPIGSFIEDKLKGITKEDCRLILPFEKEESSEFAHYEHFLLDSPYFDTDNFYETGKYRIYIYNLEPFADDFQHFLNGKYTQLSTKAKSLINIYWGKMQKGRFYPHPKIEAYLNPTILVYEKIAEELGLEDITTLVKNKEVLDPPNIEKEIFLNQELIEN